MLDSPASPVSHRKISIEIALLLLRRFSKPLDLTAERFVWDYWHVPDQYTLLRTPADQFFPEEAYQQLEDALLEYGEEQLGCRGMSPVWLSYYVDGCRQVALTDVLHQALKCAQACL